jgi:hypothetical protein
VAETSNGVTIKTSAELIDVPIDDFAVHVDVPEPVIYIEAVADIDEMSVGSNPAASPPTVIKGTDTKPVPIAVQPGTDDETGAESDQTTAVGIRIVVVRVVTPQNRRIVFRNINDLRLCGFDSDHIGLDDDLLLGGALENSGSLSLRT